LTSLDEPAADTADPAELFASYLTFYRQAAIDKVTALSPEDRRVSRVDSGWTPVELLNHLAFMERRWFVWGFLGEAVEQPWGDSAERRWHLDESVAAEEVAERLQKVGARTTEILRTRSLDETGSTGGRFGEHPPSLAWICFHVLQEYARHVGHLDIVVELAGGPTGE
jgi:uncharacterized damage-inducible protein DinB